MADSPLQPTVTLGYAGRRLYFDEADTPTIQHLAALLTVALGRPITFKQALSGLAHALTESRRNPAPSYTAWDESVLAPGAVEAIAEVIRNHWEVYAQLQE